MSLVVKKLIYLLISSQNVVFMVNALSENEYNVLCLIGLNLVEIWLKSDSIEVFFEFSNYTNIEL